MGRGRWIYPHQWRRVQFRKLVTCQCAQIRHNLCAGNKLGEPGYINGYSDDALLLSVEIDLTFDHVTHNLNWQGLDRIKFVASGGGITNEHVENAGWFSTDDLSFLAWSDLIM